MTERVVKAAANRDAAYRAETAELLHDLAFSIESMARAMDEGDDILGVLAGEGIANLLPALPKNVRDVFMENLTDEATRGYRADKAYLASQEVKAGDLFK